MTAPAEDSAVREAVRGHLRDPGGERGRGPDVLGALVLGGCAVWPLISAAGRDGRPEGALLAVLAVTAGYVFGRISGSLVPVATATVVSVGALVAALVSSDRTFGTTVAVVTPSGGTGAVTALLVLAAGAACCAATAARRPAARAALRVQALVVAGTASLLGSFVGFVAALGVLLCSLAAARMRRRLLALAGLGLVTALVVGVSWAVAERALPEGLSVSLEGQLTQHRVALWHDAAGLAKENPLFGVGPDRFGDLSPTVSQSLDTDGTPHSAPLQQAAEQGVVGVLLLGAVFGWLLYGLGRSPCSTPVVLTAGATLTALAVLASVGNALSFTPVTAGASLLAGLATARRAADPA
ncbi:MULTISPECIES: O-antigen ligase family protein [unclassified Streptomyces]|uniref:O-antigen ligase family protein n=1 Tax=unclassified Streptomyces TaxID=2593676 RepID=UPI003644FDAF